MVHLFLNTDDYLTAQTVARIKADLGDPELASLNSTDLSGERVGAADLLAQASMMPFLCARRLILARGWLTALGRRMKQSQNPDSAAHREAALLLDGLPTVPDSCDLLFVEPDFDRNGPLWKGFTLPDSDGEARAVLGLNVLAKQPGFTLHALSTPRSDRDVAGWIRSHADAHKVALQPGAVALLVDFIGADLRRLASEIEKLSLYAGSRPVTPDDVRLLVRDTREEQSWALTDALSERNGSKAFRALAELWRDGENPFALLGSVAANYRTILRTKTLMAPPHNLRTSAEIARVLEMKKSFPAEKAMRVVGRYSFRELDDIMERLLEANRAMVTGADQATEMELLVADLTLKPRAPAHG